jgi:hypothetical protein
MNMLDRIITFLGKFDLPEAHQLRNELDVTRHLHPNAEGILQLKLLALKNAHKNSAEAVKALEHLELVDEALQFHAVLTRQVTDTAREVNES